MTQALRPLPLTAAPTPRPVVPPLPLVRRWDRRQTLMLLALLAVWLVARPWSGLWHDSRLYAAQALNLLQPEQFRNDLYFMFGSQDRFTVFSPLYSACIQAFGLEGGSRLLHLAGSALWLGGAYCLLSALLRGAMLWVALAWLLLLPTEYDALKVFSLAEPYLTPRLFGEALGLFAIACLLRGQARWLWLLLPLSLALHPLMALGTLGFCALYLAAGERRFALLLVLGGALLAAACALGVAPFDRLLHTMDAAWFAEVARLTALVTWEGWHFSEMGGRTLVAFSLVLTAASLSGGWRARFYLCIALTGALGLLATWIGTGLFHNLLLLQIQPWRALWLVQLAAVVAMASLLATFWQRGRVFQVVLAACVLGLFARDGYGAVLTLLAGIALRWLASHPPAQQVSDRVYGWLCGLLLVLASVWLAAVDAQATAPLGVLHWNYTPLAGRAAEWGLTLWRLGGAALLGLGLLLALWHWAGRRQWLPALALAALLLAGAAALSLRYDSYRMQLSEAGARAAQAAFLPLIPPQATVYWEGELRASWFVLQRASYASLPQTFGMVFNRGTALEGVRRLERLERLGAHDVVLGQDRHDMQRRRALMKRPGPQELAYVCADPALHFVVLTQRLGALAVARADDAAYGRSYFLYDCARLRQQVASH